MGQELDLLTTGEAALALHVTDETIRRWITAGRIPAITLPSGQFRIRRDYIDGILSTPSATDAGQVA